MSTDALGLILLIIFSFICGHDYKGEHVMTLKNDAVSPVAFAWMMLGMFGWLFGWIHIG